MEVDFEIRGASIFRENEENQEKNDFIFTYQAECPFRWMAKEGREKSWFFACGKLKSLQRKLEAL